jgi:6,7-dimethyl-8-ribityllumazine synthase
MVRHIAGELIVENKRFAVVVTRFNEFVTSKLEAGAVDMLVRHGCAEENITVVRVPGSFEIPLAAMKLAKSGAYDAIVCLGCLIRGETPHFDYISSEVTKGIAKVGLDTGVPATYGVITADTLEQSIHRAGAKAGNKGAEAAGAAIEMANVLSAMAAE